MSSSIVNIDRPISRDDSTICSDMHAAESMFHPISHCEEVLQNRAIAADLNDDAIEDKSKQAPAALSCKDKRQHKERAAKPQSSVIVTVSIDSVPTTGWTKTVN